MFRNLNDERRTKWRNSEDELLKAFVMKYGTQSWSRISCTLRYKTPNQCRERWHEYLDPSLQKDWDPIEDDKLLKMVKTFPNQWKTIAGSLNRTSQQCLSRFEDIVDNVSLVPSINVDVDLSSANSVQNELTKQGIIYPHTQPPTADTVNLDQDEALALKEAYSRLANVQNKKERTRLKKAIRDSDRSKVKLRKYKDLLRAGVIYSHISTDTNNNESAFSLQDNCEQKPTDLGKSHVSVQGLPEEGSIEHSLLNSKNPKLLVSCVSRENYRLPDACSFRLSFEECKTSGTVFPRI